MRFTVAFIFVLMALSAGASALPGPGAKLLAPPARAIPVRMICDPRRCFDPRNGAYSQSGCDRRGCYQSGPVIGYLSPQELRDLTQQHGYRNSREDERHDRRRDRRWGY